MFQFYNAKKCIYVNYVCQSDCLSWQQAFLKKKLLKLSKNYTRLVATRSSKENRRAKTLIYQSVAPPEVRCSGPSAPLLSE